MTLLEQVEHSEQADQQAKAQARADAAKLYRVLLDRADHPQAGDADKLREVLPVLGLSLADFKLAVEVSGEIRRLRAICYSDESAQERAKAQEHFERVLKVTVKKREEAAEASAASERAMFHVDALSQAWRGALHEFHDLEQSNARILNPK